MTRLFRTLALSACLLALLAPSALAGSKVPEISSVSPKRVAVGEKLVLRGKNFLPGRGRSRVYFLRGRGKLAWAPADTATKRRLVVTVPDSIVEHLTREGTGFAYTRFRLRVLARKFGRATRLSRSPLITAASDSTGGGGGGGPTNTADGDCDRDGVINSAETDDDNDVVIDTTEESTTKTDACDSDTDGDAIEDGYEWQSALDLNNNPAYVLPYPGKRPYPNPLDGSDAGTDYDGDGLTLTDEYRLWIGFGGHTLPLNYSDGTQITVVENAADHAVDYDGNGSTTAAEVTLTAWALDDNGDGKLWDNERDADNDGLMNWDEAHGQMTQDWWTLQYKQDPKEARYPLTFAPVDIADPDSDGDGRRDGGDDQDHDGLSNAFEVHRPDNWFTTYVSTVFFAGRTNPWARTQPFNPCKPIYSGTCHIYPPFDYYQNNEDWASPCTPAELGPAPTLPSMAPGSYSC